MDVLIDTHVCIWLAGQEEKLSNHVKQILSDKANTIWISQMSLLEIVIKQSIGKLPNFLVTIDEFVEHITKEGYKVLSLKQSHLKSYNSLNFPSIHRDPFDRYLIATAICEAMPFITKDNQFQHYHTQHTIIW